MGQSFKPPAKRPCASCPYRKDVPSGVWAADEYAKLVEYDRPTYDQPARVFVCHQQDEHVDAARICGGWAGTHDGVELMALRFAVIRGELSVDDFDAVVDYVSPVPLFESGLAAAKHGIANIENPDEDALKAMRTIERVRTDIRYG